MHVPNLHWIVIEDAAKKNKYVEDLLIRSKIPYTYLFTLTSFGFPGNV